MRRVSLPAPPAAVLAAVLLLPMSSCIVAAVAAGAAAYGAISYHENEAWMDFHTELQPVWQAALESLQEHGYAPLPGQQPGPTGGEIRAGDAYAKVERHPGGFTRVRARVGNFDTADNRRLAGLILEGIKRRVAP